MIISQLVARLGFQYNPASANAFNASMQQMQSNVQSLQNNIQQMSATSQSALKGLAAGVGFSVANIAFTLGQKIAQGLVGVTTGFITAGDEYAAAMMRLGQATSGPEQATQVYDALYRTARQTGVAIMDTSKVFMQFNPAMERAGFAVSDTTDLIDGLNKAMVISGSSTARTGAVLTQIGQALNSGNFAGDELKSFLENAPSKIIEEFAKGIGKSVEELKKLGSTGKLVNATVIPGLRAAARAAQMMFPDEMASVSLAWKGLGHAVTDFGGKLNKLLGVNRNLSRAINAVADAFEWMAKGVTVVQGFVDKIGGLTRIFWSLVSLITAYFMPAFLLAVGPAALAMVGGLGGAFRALSMILSAVVVRLLMIAAPFAALAAWFLVVEDFVMWMRGGSDTLFGDKFGDFDKVVQKMKDTFQGYKDWLFQQIDLIVAKIAEMWNNFTSNMPPALRSLLGVSGGPNAQAAPTESQAGVAQYEGQGFFESLGTLARNLANTSGLAGALERNGWNFRNDMPDVSGRVTGAAASINPNQNNNFNNTINVTATGTDGASIATAAQSGVTQANDGALVRLGDSLARGLLMSSPRSEAAAQ